MAKRILCPMAWSDKKMSFAKYLTVSRVWNNYIPFHWEEGRLIHVCDAPVVVVWCLYNHDEIPVAYITPDYPTVVYILGDEKVSEIIAKLYFKHEKSGSILMSQAEI